MSGCWSGAKVNPVISCGRLTPPHASLSLSEGVSLTPPLAPGLPAAHWTDGDDAPSPPVHMFTVRDLPRYAHEQVYVHSTWLGGGRGRGKAFWGEWGGEGSSSMSGRQAAGFITNEAPCCRVHH